jgi:hypothetical protein
MCPNIDFIVSPIIWEEPTNSKPRSAIKVTTLRSEPASLQAPMVHLQSQTVAPIRSRNTNSLLTVSGEISIVGIS